MNDRVLFIRHHCSRSEQRLMRALRVLGQQHSDAASLSNERLEISMAERCSLLLMIRRAYADKPEFELLGPNSPCVSRDELRLLATLRHFGMEHDAAQADDSTAPLMQRLFRENGRTVQRAGFALRSRPDVGRM
ncbi:hypothetical protein [Kushneria aurantia]|uniref:Arsenate reductase n=1 Tax=Kushneria aurantia TaxID=504092 RepID=A0ABV6G214_9GAMM|nr:hypothetical protein [Kushneria aurantia]